MATGERNFTTSGRQVVKPEALPPVPPGDYDAKIRGKEATIKVAPGVGKIPYVEVPFELLGTAPGEGRKNRAIYARLFTSLALGKDGRAMVDRQGQITQLAFVLGETFSAPLLTKDGEDGRPVDYLDPVALQKWLIAHDGVVVRLHTKIEKGSNGYPDKAVIAYFIEPDGAGPAGAVAVPAGEMTALFQ